MIDDNGNAASNYCYEHGVFYRGTECPDCKLEAWDEFVFEPHPTETFIPLEEV